MNEAAPRQQEAEAFACMAGRTDVLACAWEGGQNFG